MCASGTTSSTTPGKSWCAKQHPVWALTIQCVRNAIRSSTRTETHSTFRLGRTRRCGSEGRGLKDLSLWIFSRFFAQLCPLASFLVSNRSRLEMIPTLLWVTMLEGYDINGFLTTVTEERRWVCNKKMNLICVILLIRFLLVFNRNCQRPPSCQNLLPEPHTSQAPTVVGNFSTNLSWCNFSPPWVIF